MMNENTPLPFSDVLKRIIGQADNSESSAHLWPTLTEDEFNTYADTVREKIKNEVIGTAWQKLTVLGTHLQERDKDIKYRKRLENRDLREHMPNIASIYRASVLVMGQLGFSNQSLSEEKISRDYNDRRLHYVDQLMQKDSVAAGGTYLQNELSKQIQSLDNFINSSNAYIFFLGDENSAFNAEEYVEIFKKLIIKITEVSALAKLQQDYQDVTWKHPDLARPATEDGKTNPGQTEHYQNLHHKPAYQDRYDATVLEYKSKNPADIKIAKLQSESDYASTSFSTETDNLTAYARIRALDDLLSPLESELRNTLKTSVVAESDGSSASDTDNIFINKHKWLGVLSSSHIPFSSMFNPSEHRKLVLKQLDLEETRSQTTKHYREYWEELKQEAEEKIKAGESKAKILKWIKEKSSQLDHTFKELNQKIQLLGEEKQSKIDTLVETFHAERYQEYMSAALEEWRVDNISTLEEKKELAEIDREIKRLEASLYRQTYIKVRVNGSEDELARDNERLRTLAQEAASLRGIAAAKSKSYKDRWESENAASWQGSESKRWESSNSYQHAKSNFTTDVKAHAEQKITDEYNQQVKLYQRDLRNNRAEMMALLKLETRCKDKNRVTPDLTLPKLEAVTNLLIMSMPVEHRPGPEGDEEYIRFYMTLLDDNQSRVSQLANRDEPVMI